MELEVRNASGAAAQFINVADAVFARPFNEALVHQVVTAYLAGARTGTRAQKNRSQVSGGGSKPWRQKGTGRARAGSTRGPLWRGGGVTFAARPQNHSQKVNRKMYRAAMRAIFSELLRQDRLLVVDELVLPEVKTKRMINFLERFNLQDQSRVLIVAEEIDVNLYLSARNLPGVIVDNLVGLDPVSLVGADKVVVTLGVLQHVERWLE